jgi:hypothetical protein
MKLNLDQMSNSDKDRLVRRMLLDFTMDLGRSELMEKPSETNLSDINKFVERWVKENLSENKSE